MKTLSTPGTVMGYRNELDRFLDRLWDRNVLDLPAIGEWAPVLDLTEKKEAFYVRAEIPGVDPKDVAVSLQEQVLTIRGEKKHEVEDKDEQFYRSERVYGTFTRSIRLPGPVEMPKVKATFKNGVLMILLPKATLANGMQIPVLPT